jgi:outer membrane murein-binding lipoprotein Lpp
MLRRFSILLVLVTVVSGCGPSAKEKYDAAVQEVDRAQAQLDKMRPAYDAAQQTAANAVCREITGTSPEESESATMGDVLNQLTAAPPDEGKKVDGAKTAPSGRKGDELDKLVDSANAAQKDLREKQAALTAPIAKLNEVKKVMTNIKTPGTPEAKRYEEKLAAMPEVKAYQRQQRRLELAQKEVEEAEKDLPGGGEKSAEKK